MEKPHVASDSGNPKQAGSTINQLVDLVGIELLLSHQVDENTGIEITAARAHDQPAGGSQSHAGVDRFPALDRSHARAIAEMSDDEAVGKSIRDPMHDRFAGQAVKSVALE